MKQNYALSRTNERHMRLGHQAQAQDPSPSHSTQVQSGPSKFPGLHLRPLISHHRLTFTGTANAEFFEGLQSGYPVGSKH